MKKIFLAIFLLKFVSLCSVTPDFQFATLEEQINFAAIILTGTVTSVSDPINEATIGLTDLQFYKGCLQKTSVTISGFRGSSLCGAGIPDVGDKIIVFACENDLNEADLKTNQFVLFTGWVDHNPVNLQAVQNQTRNRGGKCNRFGRQQQCLNRENQGKKKVRDILKPPSLEKPVIMIEPLPPVIVEPQPPCQHKPPIMIEPLPPKKEKPLPIPIPSPEEFEFGELITPIITVQNTDRYKTYN